VVEVVKLKEVSDEVNAVREGQGSMKFRKSVNILPLSILF